MEDYSGKVFLGRFRVDDLLSTSSDYSRYRGYDLKRNLILSINVFEYPIQSDPSVLCFQQNTLTLQTIMHPNIVPFYGLFEDQGKSFVIEKFVEGLNLGQILQQRAGKPMPPMDALVYIKSLSTALEYLHGFGLVHATVNPTNIRAARDGSVMLANFGFARNADRPMTETGVFGPPLCLAPEQIRGENVFPTTDVYALGILLYEFLTGVHPFLQTPGYELQNNQNGFDRLRQAHLSQNPPDPRRIITNLPGGLSQTILTAVAKDPKDRYQSAQEMLEISCAVLSVSPVQVADRIGARPAATSTQVVDQERRPDRPQNTPANPMTPGSTSFVAPPTPSGVQPGSPGFQGGTQSIPGRPVGGTQVVSGQPMQGTQVVSGQSWGGAGSGYAPPFPAPPFTGALEPEKSRRSKWLVPAIIAVLGILLVCVLIGVWAGLPYIRDIIATTTPTPTATLTQTPTLTAPAPTIPVPPTAPIVIPPTEPLPPPTIELPPTNIPTEVPTPTIARSAFKVTIKNGLPEYIYAFRDGTIMGTDPIPPGMYIYYLNIPGGSHNFVFCYEMNMTQCQVERQVVVDDDITITVK